MISDPRAIRSGPGGKLWTASADQLVSIPPRRPGEASQATTINGMAARGIAASGGRLWIADFGGQRIVSTAPGGTPSFFAVGGGPQEVAGGPSRQVAYSNPGTDPQTVGRIRLGGTAKRTKVPQSDPFGIAFAPDGHWWFAEFAKHALGRLSRAEGGAVRGAPRQLGPALPDRRAERHHLGVPGDRPEGGKDHGRSLPRPRSPSAPTARSRPGSRKASVKFRFRSSARGSSFKCALKRGGSAANFRPLQLAEGVPRRPRALHFLVRAKSMGGDRPVAGQGPVQGRSGLTGRASAAQLVQRRLELAQRVEHRVGEVAAPRRRAGSPGAGQR